MILAAMEESGLPYVEAKGEAAFYGPKIDFIIKSAIGTEYAISTNQLDFLASKRFGLTFTGSDGQEHPVYVIHRAPLGSHERFIAFLLEHYSGAFPIWLAPTQLTIIPISEKYEEFANYVESTLTKLHVRNGTLGLRVEVDRSDDRMQKKMRNALVRKSPLIAVVGEEEQASGSVSVRTREGTDRKVLPLGFLGQLLVAASESRNDRVMLDELASRV
jgi:threonyl-tRNA synthetase